MISNAIGEPLIELQITTTCSQTSQIDVKNQRLSIQEHAERLEVLRDVENSSKTKILIGILCFHVPIGHGIHDDDANGLRVVRLIPGVLKDHGRVWMIAEEDGNEYTDELLF